MSIRSDPPPLWSRLLKVFSLEKDAGKGFCLFGFTAMISLMIVLMISGSAESDEVLRLQRGFSLLARSLPPRHAAD